MMETFAHSLPTIPLPPSNLLENNQGPLIAALKAFISTPPHLEDELIEETGKNTIYFLTFLN